MCTLLNVSPSGVEEALRQRVNGNKNVLQTVQELVVMQHYCNCITPKRYVSLHIHLIYYNILTVQCMDAGCIVYGATCGTSRPAQRLPWQMQALACMCIFQHNMQ